MVYKTKLNELGEVEKYNALLVAKGYAQEYKVDYEEVYASVAHMDTVQMILALVAQRGRYVFQLDVKSAFLHGKLVDNVKECFEKEDSEQTLFAKVKQGTAKFSILYKTEGNLELIDFTYGDYDGSVENRRSTSGYVFMLSGVAVAWSSRKQLIVTLSTMEAKFIAAARNQLSGNMDAKGVEEDRLHGQWKYYHFF
ncbi:uncharacterized protein LOC131651046 [Vicia villosa]|uniref:uncharacterized protein LOC131651046 n=1 Tax=Vicia villosa TaxID=3911 RepID=UPI00273BB917|nr:uncharacterized protein LOC131651046 [Vicia villosa]